MGKYKFLYLPLSNPALDGIPLESGARLTPDGIIPLRLSFLGALHTLYSKQVGYRNSSTPVLDMNLIPVYKVYNITGDGVNILIIDDGVEYTHEDIASNFVREPNFTYAHAATC